MKAILTKIKPVLLVLTGALILIWPALYNGFPLVYSDSGTYIQSSIMMESPEDRPLFYGIFLRFTAMQAILWIPVFLQGWITSWLIRRTLRNLFPESGFLLFFAVLVLLALLTGLPWYTAQIMPDMFTALIPVILFLWFYDNHAGKVLRTVYLILLLWFTGMHLSNVFIAGLILGTHILFFFRKTWKNESAFRTKSLLAMTILVLVPFIHSAFTYSRYGKFQPSCGSNLFLAAKCLETPLLKTYIRENKHRIRIPFADSIDSIPNSANAFLWSPSSPLNQHGVNRIATNEAFGTVMRDLLRIPKYRNWFIREGISATGTQLLFHKVGSGLIPYRENTSPYFNIERHFESEFPDYKRSIQQQHGLEDNYHNQLSAFVFYGSIGIIVIGVFLRRIRKKVSGLLLLLISCVVNNAFITASLANVYDRLQVRVVWLLTFAALIICIQFVRNKKNAVGN